MTDNQQAILEFIRACDDEGEPPPTIREIMDETGISSSSVVSSNLDTLQREGYIKRLRDTSRGIRLTEKGHPRKSEYMRLADALQVHQVQIADLQAEMVRLRAMIEPSKDGPGNADDPWKSPAGDWQVHNAMARQSKEQL